MDKKHIALVFSLFFSQECFSSAYIFQNVRIFDGSNASLTSAKNVYIDNQYISKIESYTNVVPISSEQGIVIDGQGKTLMPGLIDAHTHLMLAGLSQQTLLLADQGFINIAAAKTASDMLQRGYTSVRDLGGPVFGLKLAIDKYFTAGPRIWPSGAFISQTGGHGDFRLPNELIATDVQQTQAVKTGTTAIADSPAEVRQHVREQLALGASQIKVMAGGGVSSLYDPIDVTQYSEEEIRAATEAAANWNTYVTVHAYTPNAINRAIDAGVKCIEHGQLIDDATAKRIAKEGIWWSLQPFTSDRKSTFADGSDQRNKQLQVEQGTLIAFKLAKKYQAKVAWGTDILFNSERLQEQTSQLTRLMEWYTPFEILKMATHDNAQLLMLSGDRSPYKGKLGVVEEMALADLLLVEGNPIEDIKLLESKDNIKVIMKDGKVYKNSL
ncbi:amidohydrolase family protein [Shewanella oncorhynchi]|uniref:Amidohydrolase family protein n=1 Tax=Shewanella oncorhynchi TaxID=2726434 RepID=A0AA50K9U2_9GAMM|nr:amidohydrolase family protein [Shewanella oncorhynchi]WMB71220.1 amidohydrolase family protein [Shewanella oncorhynchi]